MLVLPRDAALLGLDDPDELEVAIAVRMSMSIPICFEPVVWRNAGTGEDHVIVDGGLLSSFPIWLFDVPPDTPPAFPTFGLTHAAPAQRQPGSCCERKMKIDAFAHILPARYAQRVFELLRARGDASAAEYERMMAIDPTLTSLDARFELMDSLGEDYRQVLVMAHTSVEHEAADIARGLALTANEELAALVAEHPRRFAGWVAQAALQDGERALEAIREAVAEGALGVQVFTSMQGRCLDHPDYEPFFALMAELDRPVWIHPNRTVEWSDFPLTEERSLYGMYARAGWPSDTTVTMARLVYAGHLQRWPELKIITHHSGGTVPMLAGRLKTLMRVPESAAVAERLEHPPLEYLKRFYADTANFGNPIALRAALEFFGPEHVLFGSDFGFNPRFAPETIDDVETVVSDPESKRAVYEGNACRVLRLPPAV